MRGLGAFGFGQPQDDDEPMVDFSTIKPIGRPEPYADSPDGGGPIFNYNPMAGFLPSLGTNILEPQRSQGAFSFDPDFDHQPRKEGFGIPLYEAPVAPEKSPIYHDNTGSTSWLDGIGRARMPGIPVIREHHPETDHKTPSYEPQDWLRSLNQAGKRGA